MVKATAMALTDGEVEQICHYLKRIEAKDNIQNLLEHVKQQKQLNRLQLSTADYSYDHVFKQALRAIKDSHLSENDLLKAIHEIETAGKKHVLLFDVKDNKLASLKRTLESPTSSLKRSTLQPELDDYLTAPKTVGAIVESSNSSVIAQIEFSQLVNRREKTKQGTSTVITETPTPQRSVAIIKLDTSKRFLQIRLPEVTTANKGHKNALFRMFESVVNGAYSDSKASGLSKLYDHVELTPIQKALNHLRQRPAAPSTEFALLRNTQNEEDYGHQMWRVESEENIPIPKLDIRNHTDYKIIANSSCLVLNGMYELANGKRSKIRIHFDSISINQKTTKFLSRVLFLNLCTNSEIDDVINRIHDHTR